MDGQGRHSTLRRVLAVLMVLVPLALAVVYGLLRDAPPSWNCADVEVDSALIDEYREGVFWFIAAGELVAVGVLVTALRALSAPGRRGLRLARNAVAGAAGLTAGGGILQSDYSEDAWICLLVAVAVALAVSFALSRVARDERLDRNLAWTVPTMLGLLAMGWLLMLFAVFGPQLFVPPLAFVTAAVLAWLASRLVRGEAEAWHALALGAAFVAVVLIPGESAVILGRGHGPFSC